MYGEGWEENKRGMWLTGEMGSEFGGVDVSVADQVDDFEHELACDMLVRLRLAILQGPGF